MKFLGNIDFENQKLIAKNETGPRYLLTNIKAFKVLAESLKAIEIYNEEIEEIQNTVIYSTPQDAIYLSAEDRSQIYAMSDYLVKSAQSLLRVGSKLVPPSVEQSVSIKLPEPTDLESLVKSMSALQKAISQVVLNETIGGQIRINHWEYGSFWVELILGTQAAVSLIASIAWSAAVISKKINENKLLEQHVRSLKIKNESLEDILDGQKKLTEELLNQEAKAITSSHFGDENGDNFERTKLAIKTFSKLIQEGAEVHPALNAPEKVQNLFPNFKQLETVISQIKQIENKAEE